MQRRRRVKWRRDVAATALDAPSGPLRFVRFASPPNRLGHCGPVAPGGIGRYLDEPVDGGFAGLAAQFEGAYPYLELLAGAAHRSDPLDADVVEAYWIGNSLLDQVSTFDFGNSIDGRFRRRAGSSWSRIDCSVAAGVAHHSYHVLHVTPWTGLMRRGVVDEPLHIVDQCCVSWAQVVGAGSGLALVRRRPLVWAGSGLRFGDPVIEPVTSSLTVEPGDWVALHWGTVCERLHPRQLAWLRRMTLDQLATFAAG
jgi:hypothetical protein